MDIFTDIDIFKEIVSATLRGVVVYILLDETHSQSFLTMARKVGVNIQDLKVRHIVIVSIVIRTKISTVSKDVKDFKGAVSPFRILVVWE